MRHHFRAAAGWDFGPLFGRLETYHDFQLDASNYGTAVGVRLWRADRKLTFVYLEGFGDFLQLRDAGEFERLRGELRAGVSIDLGAIAPHLEQVVLGADLGYGLSAHRIPLPNGSTFEWIGVKPYLPVEVYTDFNLSERLNVHIDYVRRAGDRLQATRRLGGVGGLGFRYDSSDLFDLELSTEFGGGFSVLGGVVVQVVE